MIHDLRFFLSRAIDLEAEAAAGYDQLEQAMLRAGNEDLAALFHQLGGYSRLHLGEVRERYRAEAGDDEPLPPGDFRWPDGASPESPLAALEAMPANRREALQLALTLERRACDFYSVVAGETRSESVQELAQLFVEEESDHVDQLERWLRKLPAEG